MIKNRFDTQRIVRNFWEKAHTSSSPIYSVIFPFDETSLEMRIAQKLGPHIVQYGVCLILSTP